MSSIGIIGAGIAGMHLALKLQRNQVDAVVYNALDADGLAESRMFNAPTHFAPLLARERELDVTPWQELALYTESIYIHAYMEAGVLDFRGDFARPALGIDHRIHSPALMNAFAERGGKVEIRAIGLDDIDELAAKHDLLIVSTGRAGLRQLFHKIDAHSMYDKPQRWLTSAIYRGVSFADPTGVSILLTPHGEIVMTPFYTMEGRRAVITFEGLYGGAFEPLGHMDYGADPKKFERTILDTLRAHAPAALDRIDEKEFAVTRPQDVLQGGVTPAVRRAFAEVAGGNMAFALGDTHVTNDPLTGQGANMASLSAWMMADAIIAARVEGRPLDRAFCAGAEAAIWQQISAASQWTNAWLMPGPPPPHMVQLLQAAATNQRVADGFIGNFLHPQQQWDILSHPAHTARYIESMGPS